MSLRQLSLSAESNLRMRASTNASKRRQLPDRISADWRTIATGAFTKFHDVIACYPEEAMAT